MPGKQGFFLPGLPAHLVKRGNNRQAVFYDDSYYRAYLGWLVEGAQRYGCEIHAYVLMTNHVHLLLTPRDRDSISRLLQYVGRRYVPYVNHRYGRTGTLWEGRFKASVIDASEYLLRCYRYIELNPVRAGMVDAARGYRWSSYRANTQGAADPAVSPHEVYLGLGKDGRARGQALSFAPSGRSLPPWLGHCVSNSPAPSITSPPVVIGAKTSLSMARTGRVCWRSSRRHSRASMPRPWPTA